jgi:hypothetical protein
MAAGKGKEYRNPHALALDAKAKRWKLRRSGHELLASARGKPVAFAHVSHTLAPQFAHVKEVH